MATENDEQMEDEIKNFPHYSQFVDDASKLLSPPNDLPTSITIIGFEQLNEKCFCAFFLGLEDINQLVIPFSIVCGWYKLLMRVKQLKARHLHPLNSSL